MSLSAKIGGTFLRRNKWMVFRYASTVAVPKPTNSNEKELTFNPEDFKITPRARTKKPQKPPFAKNLFLGIVDTDLIAYPETLNKEELASINEGTAHIQQYFRDLHENESFANVHQDLVNLKLFGLEGPLHLGGKSLTTTEMCKCYEEIAKRPGLACSIIQHQCFGVKLLQEKASKALQDKYLIDVINGVRVVTWGVNEENLVDPRSLNTKTKLADDNKTMLLNGKKTFVTNADANIIMILAETETMNVRGFHDRKISCVLVDMHSPGIRIEPISSLGLKNSNLCHVTFTDTPVSIDNILGEPGEGVEIFSSALMHLRLTMGTICTTITKDILENITKHCMTTPNLKQPISDMDAVKFKIADITSKLYAMESITYFTAGLQDEYENQDCELEAAIVKVYSSEQCLSAAKHVLDLYGASSYVENHWGSKAYRDALGLCISTENNDSLKLAIAIMGISHAGMEMRSTVKKMRNPFFNPMYSFKKMWQLRRQHNDDPPLTLHLSDYIHPSLQVATDLYEYSVQRLKFGTEMLLIRNGPDIINKHIDLVRLANAAIDTFTMNAVLGRASRSYCIGLRNSDYEALMAHAFCLFAMERVKDSVNKIVTGRYGTNDENNSKVAGHVYKHKGYYAEHPLTKNF